MSDQKNILFHGKPNPKFPEQLHEPLEDYVTHNFPQGLVRLVRNSERGGLTKARMRGSAEAKGEVLVFFDSHMEVNIEWLEPLLTEIAKNSSVVAMATLDYVQPDTLYYKYNDNYLTRYGWNWRLIFFETFFRDDQVGGDPRKPRDGASMVGAAFAIDRKYFSHLGGYDDKMTVWGGENLEMSWRVWLCGGRLLHVPCSRIGHVARGQPYSFPGGREKIEHFNLKRAACVWMQNYTRYVYKIFPDMKTLDVGDLSERLELKSRLKCKDFSWYLENVWPELGVLDEKATHWGQVMNSASELCLDNNGYLFQAREALLLEPCVDTLDYQGFALKTDGLFKTSLQCVVCRGAAEKAEVALEDCIIGPRDKWTYTSDHHLVHITTQLCLDIHGKKPILNTCQNNSTSQNWIFYPFKL